MIVKTYPGCIPFSQSYRCNVDEIDIASKLLNDSIVYNVRIPHIMSKVIQMVQEEKQPDSFYEFNSNNISLEERLTFKALFNEDIYDNLSIAFKDSQYRFIYLSHIEKLSSLMVKWSAFSPVNATNFNFVTFFLGKKVTEDFEIIKLCLDMIRTDLNNYLLANGVPLNRITNFGPDIIAMDNNLATVSDAKFILNYFLYIFKKLDDCLDIKYTDFVTVYEALVSDLRYCNYMPSKYNPLIPILNYTQTMVNYDDESRIIIDGAINKIYHTAITGNHSPNTFRIDPVDYSNLLEEVYKELITVSYGSLGPRYISDYLYYEKINPIGDRD